MSQGIVVSELGILGGEIGKKIIEGKKVIEGPVLPTRPGTPIANSLEESSLGPTNQAGTKQQMSFQTPS